MATNDHRNASARHFSVDVRSRSCYDAVGQIQIGVDRLRAARTTDTIREPLTSSDC